MGKATLTRRAKLAGLWQQTRHAGSERGAAVMEMALVGPLLFLLLFGITEFGRAVWLYDTASHAAREASRYAMVRGAESGRPVNSRDIENMVQNVIGLDT